MSATTSLLKEVGARISGGENKKSFNLLYKGTDKVDVEEFHVKCDAKGPTVTVLYGKFNTLFGGYTSQDWGSNKKRTRKDENAFLFYKKASERAECVFLPIIKEKADRAITCDAKFGPTFGGGMLAWEDYDLQAFRKDKKPEFERKDDEYIQLNGSLNVACAYDVEGSLRKVFPRLRKGATDDVSFEQSEKVRAKSKDINSGTLLVKRIEVYQVVEDELPRPWKTKPEDDQCSRMKHKLETKEPLAGLDIKHYNILLIGMIGSGKSSFYNTLATVFSRKVIPHAPARNSSKSVTNEIKAYDITSESGDRLMLRIYDIRGFEDERGYDHELEPLLDGKITIGYQFPDKPEPLRKEHLKPATLNDEIHLVCFVTGISNFGMITSELRSRFEAVKSTVAKKGLPMVVVATKLDQICPKISEDADHVYKSPKAELAARTISDFFGIPIKHVYPVVNYVSEGETHKGKDRLALQAIYEMILLTEAYIQKHRGMVEKADEWAEREKELPSLRDANEKEITLMKLHTEMSELGARQLRVLVVGPTKSGKSGFIDSISSALRDDIVMKAAGERSDSRRPEGVSSTQKFQMHPMKYKHESGNLKQSKVYFGDTPGFQEEGGITVEHVKYILKGHVPNKYEIQNGIEKNSKGFISRPSKQKNIHCVCFVFACKAVVDGLSEKLKTTIEKVLDVVSNEDIPYIAILTKGDEDNEAVVANKRRVFASKSVKECKEKLMEIFKFRQKIIFPVVNYVQENTVNLQADALLIAAFNEILKKGKEYLEESDDEDEDDETVDSDVML